MIDSGSGSVMAGVSVVEEECCLLVVAVKGAGVVVSVFVLVVCVRERVVVVMGVVIVVSQGASWGRRRRGSKVAGEQCGTKVVSLFTIAGVHAGGGQDKITATINGSCTALRRSGKNEWTAEPQSAFQAGCYTRCRISIHVWAGVIRALGRTWASVFSVGGLQGSNANANH